MAKACSWGANARPLVRAPSPTPQQRPYHPCAHIMPTNTYPTQAQLQVHVHTLAYMPTPKTRVLATKPFQRLTSMKNQDIQNPWRLTRTPLARHRTPFTPPRARSPRTPPHAHPARPRALPRPHSPRTRQAPSYAMCDTCPTNSISKVLYKALDYKNIIKPNTREK